MPRTRPPPPTASCRLSYPKLSSAAGPPWFLVHKNNIIVNEESIKPKPDSTASSVRLLVRYQPLDHLGTGYIIRKDDLSKLNIQYFDLWKKLSHNSDNTAMSKTKLDSLAAKTLNLYDDGDEIMMKTALHVLDIITADMPPSPWLLPSGGQYHVVMPTILSLTGIKWLSLPHELGIADSHLLLVRIAQGSGWKTRHSLGIPVVQTSASYDLGVPMTDHQRKSRTTCPAFPELPKYSDGDSRPPNFIPRSLLAYCQVCFLTHKISTTD
ncbi:hypothetical protein FPV67DRAFT_1451896 [Lyophyllum atratum]|nr:hypothetical protein FPV67DRAFT_1451896 [Lyophyllum atratum]